MPRPAPLLAVLLVTAILPARAAAEVASADFSPHWEKELVGLGEFSYDSDWFPKDAALQLRLIIHAGDTVRVEMPGEARYDWEPQAIRFEGDADAGELTFDVGVEVDAKIRFDVAGIQWESDILGPYDYAVISTQMFTPYLLPGNPDRPVIVDDTTDGVTIASVDVVPDILIAHGHLDLDLILEVQGSLECASITATTIDPAPAEAVITEELADAPLAAGPGPLPDPFVVDASVQCTLESTPTILINPHLVMEIFGKEYEVAGIEVPVDLPPTSEPPELGPLALLFDRPPPAPDPTTTGDETDSESDAGTGSSGTGTGGATTSESEGASEGDTSGAATATDTDDSATRGGLGGPGDEGCACRADDPAGAPGALALLGLVLAIGPARRRR
ncbi:MAG: MYXO-CTERM sorting domain-containing protein [Nannocystaceae bacterium]